MRIELCQSVLILFAVTLASQCVGQDSPFDVPVDNVFGDPTAEEAASNTDETATSPLVQQLTEHAGRGNVQLAEAVSSMARIGRWTDVNRFLEAAGSRNISPTEMAEMARRIGPSILLRIKLHEDVKEPARAVVDKLGKAAKDEAESPDRLRRAIDGLDADSIDDRLASARALLAGGNPAVTELVAAAVSETPPAPRDEILRTMLRLGDGGTQSLRQLALYGQPAVRRRAVESLARIDRNAAVPELITAIHAADSTPDEVASANEILRTLASTAPSREASVAMLFTELKRLQDVAQQIDNDSKIVTVWSIDANGTGVTQQPTRLIMSAYRDAVDMASRLRRIGGLSHETSQTVLIADMAYRVMVDPDWGDPDQIQSVRAAFGPLLSGVSLSAAIGESMSRNDLPALLGLLRMIDPDSSALQKSVLLRSSGPNPTPLVQAASSPEPRVRYEAALAIAQIAGDVAYAGSSRVEHCLREIRALDDKPTAILIETRSNVIVPLETILSQLGYKVLVVGSVARLQRLVASGGDLRMILSKTELADFPAIEMIDLVRRTDRGRDVPIVMYGADVSGLTPKRWSAPAVLIDRPASTAAFAELMDEIDRRRRLPPLSAVDRQILRATATDEFTDPKQAR